MNSRVARRLWIPAVVSIPLVGLVAGVAASTRWGIPGVVALPVIILIAWALHTRFGPTLALLPALLIPIDAMPRRYIGAVPIGPSLSVLVFFFALIAASRPRLRLTSASIAFLFLSSGAIVGLAASGLASSQVNASQLLLVWLAGLIIGEALQHHPDGVDVFVWTVAALALIAISEVAGLQNPWITHFGATLYADVGSGTARAMGSFGHPSIAGDAFAVVGVLGLSRKGAVRNVATPILMIGAISTVSRGAIIALVVGSIASLVGNRASRKTLATVVVAALALVLLVSSVPTLRTSFENRVFTNAYQQVSRSEGLQTFADTLVSKPLNLIIGGGLSSDRSSLSALGGSGGVTVVDDQFVTSVYDSGLFFALGGFALLLFLGVRSTFSSNPAGPALLAALVTLGFAEPLYWHSTAVLYWAIASLAAAPPERLRTHPSSSRPSSAR